MTDQQAAEHYGAQMYLPKGDEPNVAMLFYRWHTEILNTGEFRTNLQYLNFNCFWENSFDRDQEGLIKKLKQIDGVPAYDRAAAEKAIREKELKLWGKDEYERITKLRAENKRRDEELYGNKKR